MSKMEVRLVLPMDLYDRIVAIASEGAAPDFMVKLLRDGVENISDHRGTDAIIEMEKNDPEGLANKIRAAVKQTGSVSGAAREMAVPVRTLWRVIKRLALSVEQEQVEGRRELRLRRRM